MINLSDFYIYIVMNKKNILLLSFFLTCSYVFAQSYTEHLERQGKVVVTQNDKISNLVNNQKKTVAETPATTEPKHTETDESAASQAKPSANARPTKPYGSRQRYNSEGYRIQVYTGGNSRADKQAAANMQAKIRSAFPEISTYVHFVSPHWVCRVGDFKSRDDAMKYVRKIRARGLTYEARLVKSNIFVAR